MKVAKLLTWKRTMSLAVVLLCCSMRAAAQTSGVADTAGEVKALREEVRELREAVAALQKQVNAKAEPTAALPQAATAVSSVDPAQAPQASAPAKWGLPEGTTLNLLLDSYYGYNFNQPLGRVNLLRAYDVTANNFTVNQATAVLERAPDVAAGRRWGARVDLQFGQATSTLQGNAANEPRPQVYRNIYQAYGTYVVGIGKGLTVDFGKWGSSLGMEGNYVQDQMNYSRSYWFNALPFYHTGARLNYKVNDKLEVNYWVTNGAQQAEDFNGFKDELFGVVLQPRKSVSWTVNYYLGQEHADVAPIVNPGVPTLPTQPGLSVTPVVPAPDGRLHILDSYASWQASAKTTFALEGDYEIQRLWRHASAGRSAAPSVSAGGAAYARRQLSDRTALAWRGEYLSDRGGQFSGKTAALKETTLTYEYKLADGFSLRPEWRYDWANQPLFLSDKPGVLKKGQNTLTLGVFWWWGQKEGTW